MPSPTASKSYRPEKIHPSGQTVHRPAVQEPCCKSDWFPCCNETGWYFDAKFIVLVSVPNSIMKKTSFWSLWIFPRHIFLWLSSSSWNYLLACQMFFINQSLQSQTKKILEILLAAEMCMFSFISSNDTSSQLEFCLGSHVEQTD